MDPIDRAIQWLDQVVLPTVARPSHLYELSTTISGLYNATQQWDDEVVKLLLPQLGDLRWEASSDTIVVVVFEGTAHSVTGYRIQKEVDDALEAMGVGDNVVRGLSTSSIRTATSVAAGDSSWSPRLGPPNAVLRTVVVEVSYGKSLKDAQNKVNDVYKPLGYVNRVVIIDIKPPPLLNTVVHPDPSVSVGIEQWVLHPNAVPFIDQSPLHAPLRWNEGTPLHDDLLLPLVDFFNPLHQPPPGLLPVPLQPPLFATAMVRVPAARLQAVFEAAAELHHERGV